MQPHLREQLSYPAADLDETKPYGVELHPRHAAGDQLPL